MPAQDPNANQPNKEELAALQAKQDQDAAKRREIEAKANANLAAQQEQVMINPSGATAMVDNLPAVILPKSVQSRTTTDEGEADAVIDPNDGARYEVVHDMVGDWPKGTNLAGYVFDADSLRRLLNLGALKRIEAKK